MWSFLRGFLLLFLWSVALGQTPDPAGSGAGTADARASAGGVLPVITFDLDFPQSQPEHYSIRVPVEGPGHYQSSGRISRESDDTDEFEFDFALSKEIRDKIFRLAKGAGHFQRDVDSRQKNLAFTGKKTLAYKDEHVAGEASFNYAADPAARDLTELFQNLSATLEFGHRLDYDHRYQKLALDEELKRMQAMAHDNALVEVAAIQPILEKIVADHSVVNIARARAQQLLDGANGR
ncbi:MAG TPA: hypothetical protein VMI10_04605 [Terriglobales bacterium]|nr:hypothetical protein [Terriglobales bacterium]